MRPFFIILVTLIVSTAGMALPSLTPPSHLVLPALECYRQAISNNQIYTMNKQYKTDVEIEKLAVSLCTYSDAVGSLRCYLQAANDSQVIPASKNTLSIFLLEQKQARLCSNSGASLLNVKTGDADAIDCFKMAMDDDRLLVAAKKYMSTAQLEDLVVKLCISANGLGVQQCYLKSLGNADGILEANKVYTGPVALDQSIVDLCKGTRLRQ